MQAEGWIFQLASSPEGHIFYMLRRVEMESDLSFTSLQFGEHLKNYCQFTSNFLV